MQVLRVGVKALICFGMLSVTAVPSFSREGSTRREELVQDETFSVLECAEVGVAACLEERVIVALPKMERLVPFDRCAAEVHDLFSTATILGLCLSQSSRTSHSRQAPRPRLLPQYHACGYVLVIVGAGGVSQIYPGDRSSMALI